MLHNYASAQNLEVAIGLNTIELHVVSEFDLKRNFTLYVFSDFPAIQYSKFNTNSLVNTKSTQESALSSTILH